MCGRRVGDLKMGLSLSLEGKLGPFFPFCISLNFLFTFTYNSVNCNDLRNTLF